jgi:SPP1 family predicted phage head-tail adaptor
MMNAGRLDQRVTLQSKSVTRAANGAEVVSWVPVATLWAEVRQIRGKEFFAAAQMQEAVDHQVRIRYRAGVTRDMRLLWNGQPLDIVAVIALGRNEVLEIMCLSGVRNG